MDRLAKVRAEAAAYRRRQQEVKAAFDETGILVITNTIMALHPSARVPGTWQMSYFDENGPYGHEEGATREEAIDRALEYRNLADVAVMTENDFMQLTMSPQFIEGSKRVRYAQLDNQMRYEFGYSDDVTRYMEDAIHAADTTGIDDAIKILEVGLRTLRRQCR